MSTLYRKYRPQSFSDLVGQNHVKITLEHEIESNKIAHAYIFCGPRGVGKTTVARVLAKSLNCLKRKEGEHDPCGECDSCLEITAGRSLDIIEIDAASHTGVDNVRENVIAVSRIAPTRYRYKVFIIDEAHMLTTQAFNALLKVLEEPPANVVFILCTTEAHKIPATIISRCQRFDFRRFPLSDITARLQFIAKEEKIKIDRTILEAIARHSEGYMRDAVSLFGQVVAVGGSEITAEEADLVIPRSDLSEVVKLIGFLSQKDAGRAIELVNRAVDEGIELKRLLTDLIEILRKMMLMKTSPALAEKIGLECGEAVESQIAGIISGLELGRIIAFTEKFMAARNDLKGSFIEQLPLEIAILELCSPDRSARPLFSPGQKPAQPAGTDNPAGPASDQKTPAAPEAGSGKLNKEIIAAKWNEVLAKVKKYNHSLSFILRVCKPIGLNGRELCLAFKYKFHKDRIGETNIRQMVEKVLFEVYGSPLILGAIVDETIEVGGEGNIAPEITAVKTEPEEAAAGGASAPNDGAKEPSNNMIENLLKTFGGRVIN
ncbi:MAG: DNA polymerase III subunit gamma/tau [Candidatus Falkowbacteria bacterium]